LFLRSISFKTSNSNRSWNSVEKFYTSN